MAKFRIWAKSIEWLYLDVEAPTLNDAMEIADETYGEYYHPADGGWEMNKVDAERLPDDADVDYTYEEMFGDE